MSVMAAQEQIRAMGMSLHGVWVHGRQVERVGYVVGVCLLLSGIAHFGVFLVDGGPWEGPVSWRKPVTFGLSFGLTLVTLVWVTTWIRLGERTRTIVLALFTAASVLEVALISLQAWRGVPSHFNNESSVNRTISTALAVGGGVLLVTILILTVASLRAGWIAHSDMRLAVRSGLVLLVAALIVGGVMIARGVTAVQAGNPDLAYTTAGALKPIHAVAMHAVLVLPGLAWLLGFTRWTDLLRLRIVQLGSAGYALLALTVGIESVLDVSPFSAPPIAAISAITGLAALVLAGAIAVYGVVHFPARDTTPVRTA